MTDPLVPIIQRTLDGKLKRGENSDAIARTIALTVRDMLTEEFMARFRSLMAGEVAEKYHDHNVVTI